MAMDERSVGDVPEVAGAGRDELPAAPRVPQQPDSGGDPDVALASARRRHWEEIAKDWAGTNRDALWRAHSDAVNCALVEAWASTRSTDILLKTDAFDEAASAGLAGTLSAVASRVICIDLSLEILRRARRNHDRLSAICCDVRRLPFVPGSVDAVVSNSTLDHFRSKGDITRSFRELRRVLREDGRLLVTLDNLANPVIFLRQRLPQRLLRATGLVPYFVGETLGPRALARELTDSGFSVRPVTAILHCPRVLAVQLSRLIGRSGSPRAAQRFLAVALMFERLGAWPTRFLTGYFIAVSASSSQRGGRATPSRASGSPRNSSGA
jgi:SAM-dependent methyltransferase